MLVAYFDERPYQNLNSRLLPELELEKGTYEHESEPHGLQVIESKLEDSVEFKKATTVLQYEISSAIQTAIFLQQHPFSKPYTDSAIAGAISRQLLRIAAMGITGFDKPVLDDALVECKASLQGMNDLLASYHSTNTFIQKLRSQLQYCIRYLQNSKAGFDNFNRLLFIRNCLQPAFAAAEKWKVTIIGNAIPVYTSFFQQAYIQKLYHYDTNAYPPEMIALGERLFNSNILSSNQRISCASCHHADLHFADTVKLNAGFELTDTLQRNTPSLINVAYHLRFQRDGHLLFLQDQFREVIFSHSEMGNLDERTLLRRINKNERLKADIIRIFPAAKDSLTISMSLQALDAFVHSLVNTQSPFDKYMTEDTGRIPPAVIRGFDLFMGAAKCGTCHFMPVFNGVQPPFFTKEENEIIGVLRNDDFDRPKSDTDSGLFIFTRNELHQGSFKVPTVRHLAKTFPYMHNGSLKNLDQVLLFYNLGGGGGWMMGGDVPGQTLDRQPLRLDKEQRDDIKAFLLSLE